MENETRQILFWLDLLMMEFLRFPTNHSAIFSRTNWYSSTLVFVKRWRVIAGILGVCREEGNGVSIHLYLL